MWDEWVLRLKWYLNAVWTDRQAFFAAVFTLDTKQVCKLPLFFSTSLFKKPNIQNTRLFTKFVLLATSSDLLHQLLIYLWSIWWS